MTLYSNTAICRLCQSQLEDLYDFGEMHLTGVFMSEDETVPTAPITYSRCNACGLNQLKQNYDPKLLYGTSYGYESNLNQEMKSHLLSKASLLENKYLSGPDNNVLDIASNDGTFLSFFKKADYLLGVDPLIDVVSDHYPPNAKKIANFFSASEVLEYANGRKFDLVTSNSVLYDVPDPLIFAHDVSSVLENGGYWHFEQSYLPKMVETLSFDTICHEHLLYFGLTQIQQMLSQTNMKIIDIAINKVNGGSIAVTAQKNSKASEAYEYPYLDFLIRREKQEGYTNGSRLSKFFDEVVIFKRDFRELLERLRSNKYELFGLGASTKGNMLLQYCDINEEIVSEIGEVNTRKFGKVTPGSKIPIVPESELLQRMSRLRSAGLVLPWHFRDSIIRKSSRYLEFGGKLIFPLPKIEFE